MISIFDREKRKDCGKRGKLFLTLYSTDTRFHPSTTDSFWKQCGKRRNCSKEQYLLLPQCFLINQKIVSLFVNIFDIEFLFAAEMVEPKIDMWGKELKGFFFRADKRHHSRFREKHFEIIVESGKNTCFQHFLLFLQCFPSYQRLK